MTAEERVARVIAEAALAGEMWPLVARAAIAEMQAIEREAAIAGKAEIEAQRLAGAAKWREAHARSGGDPKWETKV